VLVREVIAERDAAIARCARLEHLLDVARNAQYGRSSVSGLSSPPICLAQMMA
jgi:hypothetical protein